MKKHFPYNLIETKAGAPAQSGRRPQTTASDGRQVREAPAFVAQSLMQPVKNVANLPFIYSRIFAEGWNAGRRVSLKLPGSIRKAAAKNPYSTQPERKRWDEGFASGIA